MIEYPEARALARQLAAELGGSTICGVSAAHTPHKFAWYSGDSALYPERLCGLEVTGARAQGGYALLELGDIALSFNDGAAPRLYAPGDRLPARHQLRLDFADGRVLAATVRMYGGFLLIDPGFDNEYYRAACEGPDPLSEAFTYERFAALAQATPPSRSVKALLATEQRLPGVGNGVLQDICWHAALNPRRRLDSLDGAELRRLYDALRGVLRAMTEAGGRDTWDDLHGAPGGYRTLLNKSTVICPRCGGPILREAFMGGNIYYCADCQPR